MLVLEHDAKEILAAYGLRIPPGILVDRPPAHEPPFAPPWMVKAQLPAGGRGKAGGILRADTPDQLRRAVDGLLGTRIAGHEICECRIEAAVAAGCEAYASLSIDPKGAAIRILLSPIGGIDVETEAAAALLRGAAAPDRAALAREVCRLAERLPEHLQAPFSEAGTVMADAFLSLEAVLLEINPLFVWEDGLWMAGDAKLVIDANALPRQDTLRTLLERRASAYSETAFKLDQGFDFVVIDGEGEIGLVTTGAGLSMKIIDELREEGFSPYNFCDIRSGQMRGDPSRLIEALRRIADGPRIRAVLVNIFAGITDLGEFAELLIAALKAVPELKAPVVARLIGNGEERAEAIIRACELPLKLERDLDQALALVLRLAATEEHAPA
jgi:succinyl-CoA synthetase beta subunit